MIGQDATRKCAREIIKTYNLHCGTLRIFPRLTDSTPTIAVCYSSCRSVVDCSKQSLAQSGAGYRPVQSVAARTAVITTRRTTAAAIRDGFFMPKATMAYAVDHITGQRGCWH